MRTACAEVAARARTVRIDDAALARYAETLPTRGAPHDAGDPLEAPEPGGSVDPVERVGFVLVLDAINFGSGWFPLLRKPEGLSGYRTVERALRRWWTREGPTTAGRLRAATPRWIAEILGQDPDDPPVLELMRRYARAWSDLGSHLEREHGSDLAGPVHRAAGSAAALVRDLCTMPLYRDWTPYAELEVPFLKRAQITAHDLSRMVPGPLGRFRDLDELTMFADNLVPHVLRLDGVLRYDPALVERIERGDRIESGSPDEVEIRACAVEAVERIVALHREAGGRLTPRALDQWLWERGQAPRYKARPRHRCRCTNY